MDYNSLKQLCTKYKEQLPSHVRCTASRVVLLRELLLVRAFDYKKIPIEQLREAVELLGIVPSGSGKNGRILKSDLVSAIEGITPKKKSPTKSPEKTLKQSPKNSQEKTNKGLPTKSPEKTVKQSPKNSEEKTNRASPRKSPEKPLKTSPKNSEEKTNRASPRKSPEKPLKQSPKNSEEKTNRVSPRKSPEKPLKQSPKNGEEKTNRASPRRSPFKQSPRNGRTRKIEPITVDRSLGITHSELLQQVRLAIREKSSHQGGVNRRLKDLNLDGLIPVVLRVDDEGYHLHGGGLPLVVVLLPKNFDGHRSMNPVLLPNGYLYDVNDTNTKHLATLLAAVREVNRNNEGRTLVRDGYRNQPYGVVGYDTPYTDPQWMVNLFPGTPTWANPVREGFEEWRVANCGNHNISQTLTVASQVKLDTNRILLYPGVLPVGATPPEGFELAMTDNEGMYKLVSVRGIPLEYPEERERCFTLTLARILHIMREGVGGRTGYLNDEEVVLAQRLVNYVEIK